MIEYSMEGHQAARKAYNQGKFADALYHCRRHLTWYRLCHKAHTVPFLKSGKREARELLRIDIEALAGITDLLLRCYLACDIESQFPDALKALETAVADPRWTWKVRYFRGLWLVSSKGDREAARKELIGLNVKTCHDADLLSLYLDLFKDTVGLAEQFLICDAIICHTERRAYRLQYRCVKGIALFLAGDVKRGIEEIEHGITEYDSLESDDKSSYGDAQCALAIDLAAELKNDANLAKVAVERFEREIRRAEAKGFVGAHIAELLKGLADACMKCDEYQRAGEAYKRSLAIVDSDLTKVFFVRAVLKLEGAGAAKELLGKIATDALLPSGKYDYGVSCALVAFESRKGDDILAAKLALKTAGPQGLYFDSRRLEVIADLDSIKEVSDEGVIRRVLGRLSRYTVLQPNVFGVGFNFNNLIDDAITPSKNKQHDEAKV